MDVNDEGFKNHPFSSPLWQPTSSYDNDFDGHTVFHTMTFTQKLTWLSEAAVSIYMLAQDNPGAKCNLLFKR